MTLKVCAEPGCPDLTPNTRCDTHARAKDKARGSRQARGYDAAHDRLRAKYQLRMNQGQAFRCWRCNKPINPEAWHLGHDDHDRSRYRGPECVPCNTATSTRRSV
jgi:hypothetical protein